MMVHPAPLEDMLPRVSAVAHFAVAVHGPRVARGRRARAGDQRRPTRSRSRRSRSGCCASISAPATRCTASSRHGGDAPNIVPAHTEGTVDGARRARIDELAELVPRVHHCFEAGALATGATTRRSNDVCARLLAHGARPRARRRVPRATRTSIGRPDPDDERDDVLDRHGQRVARDAVDPSVHRDRERRRGEPPARVRGRVHQRVGRPRGARRLARDGVDRDRHRERHPRERAPRRVAGSS